MPLKYESSDWSTDVHKNKRHTFYREKQYFIENVHYIKKTNLLIFEIILGYVNLF